MSAPLPLRYEGDGTFVTTSPFWQRRADEQFVVHETYKMEEHQDRNMAAHRGYFATVRDGWRNLPDDKLNEYPTEHHLRAKALIACGYAVHQDHLCSDKLEARKLRVFIANRPEFEYAIVECRGDVVRVFTAQSQSVKAMGAKTFRESCKAVEDWIDDLLGVERGSTSKNAREAA